MKSIPNFRAFFENKMYSVESFGGSFISLSRAFVSKYVFSINVGVDNVIIMQGSGFNDVKGNEIFDGDIVRDLQNEIGLVEFKEGAFIVVYKQYIIEYLSNVYSDLRVVGNIHQNRKLLADVIDNINFKKVIRKDKKRVTY